MISQHRCSGESSILDTLKLDQDTLLFLSEKFAGGGGGEGGQRLVTTRAITAFQGGWTSFRGGGGGGANAPLKETLLNWCPD